MISIRNSNRFSTVILFLKASVIIFLIGIGCFSCAGSPERIAKPDYSQVATPSDPIDMLKNAMTALKNDFLLRKDFYTDDNLMHFFSGKYITERSDSENYTNGHLLDFQSYTEQLTHMDKDHPCDMRAFEWSHEKNEKTKGYLYFSFLPKNPLTFSAIESTFGKDGGWQSDFSPIAYGDTAMVGGRKYFRIYSTDTVKKTVEFVFGPDAVLFTAVFREEEQ